MDPEAPDDRLTVAITGPTGTLGRGLLPLLEADERIGRIVGVSRSGPAPDEPGRVEHHRGDVADPQVLQAAFDGADVVVHLASAIIGNVDAERHREVNVGGTVTAFRAAVAAGARRFVYTSSLAAYGFRPDNPVGMTEDQPLRPTDRFFYARDKAESEQRLAVEAADHPEVEVYVLRPSGVAGPHAIGAKALLPGSLAPLGRRVAALLPRLRRLPIPVPLALPAFRLQLVHHDDVGRALHLAVLGAGPPGPYNLAGDGVLTLAQLAREAGAAVWALPERVAEIPARVVSPLPLPPLLQWVQAATVPAIMDTTRAHERLGWRPRYTGVQAWRSTLGE